MVGNFSCCCRWTKWSYSIAWLIIWVGVAALVLKATNQ